MCAVFSKRLNTGDKLTITSSVTRDVSIYVLAFLLSSIICKYIRLKSGLVTSWLNTQFFESKLVAEKISCFEMTNFQALDTLTIYSNISKIRLYIQITLCGNARIQIDVSKKNRFSGEKAINYFLLQREKK